MFTALLLCHVGLWAAPLSEPSAAGPTVTAVEIVELRRAELKPKAESARSRFSPDRPGMKLIIEVQGEDVAHASHYGLLELAGASDDKNTPLKLNEDALGFHDLRKEFVEIDRDQMFFGEDNPPKDTIRIELPFDTPARSVLTVSVRGKLQLKKIQTVDVQVPTTPGEVKDEQLAKAGVKLTIVKPEEENEFAYEVSGKLDNLFETQVIDGQGKPVETMGRSRFGGDESMHCNINLTKPCPRDAKLKLTLVTKAENVPVTFDLKDLKLP